MVWDVLEDPVKVIKKTTAALLLLSIALSGCSVKTEEEETAFSEVSSTRETEETSQISVAEPEVLLPEEPDPVIAPNVAAGMDWEEDLLVPTDAYNVVIESILNYIDNYDPADPDLTYIGKGEHSGIEEMILEGDPYNGIGFACVDIDYDSVAELAIVDLTDGYGLMVMELYSYNSDYGIHPILHGYSNDRIYMCDYGYLRKRYVDTDTFSDEYHVFTGDRSYTAFIEGYYTVRLSDGVHLVNTSYENMLFSTDINSYYVIDYGVVSEYDIYVMLEEYEKDIYTDYPYNYTTITPLFEF